MTKYGVNFQVRALQTKTEGFFGAANRDTYSAKTLSQTRKNHDEREKRVLVHKTGGVTTREVSFHF